MVFVLGSVSRGNISTLDPYIDLENAAAVPLVCTIPKFVCVRLLWCSSHSSRTFVLYHNYGTHSSWYYSVALIQNVETRWDGLQLLEGLPFQDVSGDVNASRIEQY